jgi:hypothetical protein
VEYLARQGDWDLALVYSAAMFLTAAVCWLFINPRRVIVYATDLSREKKQNTQKEKPC